jgi:hypothetical protein
MLYFSYFGYSRNSRLGVNSFVGKTYWNSIIYKNDQDLSGILGIISFNGSAFL